MNATLADRLSTTGQIVDRVLKPSQTARLIEHAQSLRENGTLGRAIRVGEPIPAFTLLDFRGHEVSLRRLATCEPLVIVFVRGTWCPFCATELTALGDAYERIRSTGAELVVIAPQPAKDAEHFYALNPLPFPILIDRGATVTKAFRLAYVVPDDIASIYRSVFGVDLAEVNTDRSWQLPMPARFIIDRGVIADARVEPDYRSRTEPDETIAFLEKLPSPTRGLSQRRARKRVKPEASTQAGRSAALSRKRNLARRRLESP